MSRAGSALVCVLITVSLGTVVTSTEAASEPPGIHVAKSWDRSRIGTGGTTSATITVSNDSDVDRHVRLRDRYDRALRLVDGPVVAGAGGCATDTSTNETGIDCDDIVIPAHGSVAVRSAFQARYDGAPTWVDPVPVEDQLDVQRIEAYASVPGGAEQTVRATCPSGYLAVDGAFQPFLPDSGSFEDVSVRGPRIQDDSWSATISYGGAGQAQGKVFANCLRRTTTSGIALAVSAPLSSTATIPVAGVEVPLQAGCTGTATPVGITLADSGATGAVVTGVEVTGGRSAHLWAQATSPGPIVLSWRCLDADLGDHHRILQLHATEQHAVAAPGASELQVGCGPDQRALVAGFRGQVSVAGEARGTAYAFHVVNRSGTARPVDLQVLCVANRLARATTTEPIGTWTACNSVFAVDLSGSLLSDATACLDVAATGQPDPPTVSRLVATGRDREVRARVAVGQVRGPRGVLQVRTSHLRAERRVHSGDLVRGWRLKAGPNGKPVSPEFRVCNGHGWCSDWVTTGPVTPYGPIGAVTIVGASASGSTVSFRVRVDPNGRSVGVTVNGQHPMTTGVEPWTSELVTEEIGYWQTRTYVATATDGARTRSSEPVTIRSEAGVPEGVVITDSGATGVDQQGTVSLTLERLNGTGGTVHVTGSLGTSTFPLGVDGHLSGALFAAAANGSSVTPSVVVCNAQGLCSSPVSAPAFVPYGPIGAVQVVDLNTQLGPAFSYRVTVQPNGRPVTVSVHGHTFTTGATGTYSSATFTDTVGFDKTTTFAATASDASRSRTSASVTAVTEPPPSAIVAKGDRANNADCQSTFCHRVVVKLRHLLPNTSYTLYYDTNCGSPQIQACLTQGSHPGTHHYVSDTVVTDASGNVDRDNRVFGYPGALVWVDLDAFGQNWASNAVGW